MNTNTVDLNQVRNAYLALLNSFRSLIMSTVNSDGMPQASYAPYVKDQDNYYVYVSELSAHTDNMSRNGRIAILFIEDEDKADHLFARKRVSYQCTAYEIVRGSESFEFIMGLFELKFGNFINMLKKMEDFHLFCLHPYQGVFVEGFARAFAIEGEHLEKLSPIRDTGHRQINSATPEDLTA